TRALARATGQDEAQLAHRLMGDWDPAATGFADLVAGRGHQGQEGDARPYPFALASALEGGVEALGDAADWLAEWKWDGIRGQLVARPGAFALWSRGEELVTDRFPDLGPLRDALPAGTVLDGEVLAWAPGAARPLPFAALQTRIGRKTVPKTVLRAAPARFLAYDLLEAGGEDLRALPLATRRARLEALLSALPAGLPLAASPLLAPPLLEGADWDGLAALRAGARDLGAEGLMLKRAASAYAGGRRRGDWWKWKLDPFTVDAVMIYAQGGHGRRAGLYTDFTFAVRDGDALVPFAKAYSGLTDAEFARITAWVQAHTLERFGPVRRVPPELVFEIAFEGIQASPRHKSGIALRFPRIARWRQDKPVTEIDTLEALRGLLAAAGGPATRTPRDI
ncbi:MAG: cisplatin damage response ATP-dependent DNA ligase, partial [Fuscovulum sp.]|nr:cisplatin damage response ATP-dependent DNA ligase [Fuscovulum sp.]